MRGRVRLLAKAVRPTPDGLAPLVALGAGNSSRQVHTFDARPGFGFRLERRHVKISGRFMRDNGILHPALADQRGQSPRIHARNADNAALA